MLKKINPKVSIICAVYNEEGLFEEHLKSLVNQTYKNKEIIIVDDGSTDKTSEIGKKFAKKYTFIKYYRINHISGYGCVRPRLKAIGHAIGDVLCIVDADGYYGKNNIREGMKKLFSSEKIAAVVPRMHAWKPHNFISKYRAMVYESRFMDFNIINKGASEGRYSPWLMKRRVYSEVGGYDIRDAYSEDLRLARRILNNGYKIVHEPKCHWYHNLGGTPIQMFKKNFGIGRMHSSIRKFGLSNLFKMCYFSLFFLIIIFGFFNYYIFLLLALHPIPIFVNSLSIFIKVRKVKGKWNSFYSIIVSYLLNISYVFGFCYGLVKPYKKLKYTNGRLEERNLILVLVIIMCVIYIGGQNGNN